MNNLVSENTNQQQKSSQDSVTYDEGEGIKDKVVLTGPLSELLAQQLNVIFKKTDISEQSGEPPNEQQSQVVQLEATKESMVINTSIKAAMNNALDGVENSVVLDKFDFQNVSKHLKDVYSENFKKEYNHSIRALVVGMPEQLLKEDLSSYTKLPYVEGIDLFIIDPNKGDRLDVIEYNTCAKPHRIFTESKKTSQKSSDHLSLESMRNLFKSESVGVYYNLKDYLEHYHGA